MARINLSIDNDLFAKIEKEAIEKSTTVNLLIIDLLENLYADTSAFNYSAALMTLVKEAEAYAVNHINDTEFPLVDLASFTDICVAQAGNAKLRPSMVRARLGKMFNSLVRHGNVSGISRAKDSDGNNKFINKTAVYVVDKATDVIDK
jgi:hypothetical protein